LDLKPVLPRFFFPSSICYPFFHNILAIFATY